MVRAVTTFLGPEGTFTHQAVVALRPHDAARAVATAADALDAVLAGDATHAVVPIDNAVNGVVVPTLDALLDRPALAVVDSVVVPISFDAFTPAGSDPAQATVVVSHPHALAQCRAWIEARGLATREATSTAAACRDLTDGEIGLGPALCADLYGLDVVDRAVEDNAGAHTQFALVAADSLPRDAAGDVGLLVSLVPDENAPGGLRRLLAVLEERGVNMTNLVTRPLPHTPGLFRFLLFLSGSFTADDFAALAAAWRALGAEARAIGRIAPLHELVERRAEPDRVPSGPRRADPGFARVAVVGGGLIGGSVALRLQALGHDVTLVDPDDVTRRRAESAGLRSALAAPADADLVVVATPLDVLEQVLGEVARQAPHATVVDLGSVKAGVARAAARAGLGERYVGVHPMAGTERSGFAHASAALLVGATWAVTHGADQTAPPPRVAAVVAWVTACFAARVVVLDAAEHDRAVALVSHTPHVLAHVLLGLAEDATVPAARFLAAGSFDSGTRVAGRNPVRTYNMLADNAEALAVVLADVAASLAAYTDAVRRPDDGRLTRLLTAVADRAAEVREASAVGAPCADLAQAVDQARAQGRTLLVSRSVDDVDVHVVAVLQDGPVAGA